MMVGGYNPASVKDESVAKAATFAFGELQASKYSLLEDQEESPEIASYEVVGASTQVVAGLNIKLDMVFMDSSGDCVGSVTVVVYDRFGDRSITSWKLTEN